VNFGALVAVAIDLEADGDVVDPGRRVDHTFLNVLWRFSRCAADVGVKTDRECQLRTNLEFVETYLWILQASRLNDSLPHGSSPFGEEQQLFPFNVA
jgi:hypothetical protein